jgi:hypothetical protein
MAFRHIDYATRAAPHSAAPNYALVQTCPARSKGQGIAVVRISQFAMMPDYGIVVIRANTAERRNCPDQNDNKKQEIA